MSTMTETQPYLVQYEIDGRWHTIRKCKSFDAACALARKEGRAMKWAHMTSIIREGDPELLRRTADNDFQLS